MKKIIVTFFVTAMMLAALAGSAYAGEVYNYSFEDNNKGGIAVNLNNGATTETADFTELVNSDGKAIRIVNPASEGEKSSVRLDTVVNSAVGGEKFYTNYVMRMEVSLYIPETNIPRISLFALNKGTEGNGCMAIIPGGDSSNVFLANGQWGIGSLKLGTLEKGAWNTIEVDTILNTGVMNFYVNGKLNASQVALNQDAAVLEKMKSQSVYSVSFSFGNTMTEIAAEDVYVDNIVFRTLNKYTVSGANIITYENPKFILEFPAGVTTGTLLTKEDIFIENTATYKTFYPETVEKVADNRYLVTFPEKEIKPDTTYNIALAESLDVYTAVSLSTEKILYKGLLARNGVTLSYDFESGQMAAGTLGSANGCTSVIDNIEGYNGGKAIHLVGNANVNGKGSNILQYFPGNQNKVCFEMDIMKPDTDSQTVWQAGEQNWPDILCFNKDKTITVTDANGKVQNIGTYETNRWYNVSLEHDTTINTLNVIITDIESGTKMAMGGISIKAMKAGYSCVVVTELRELTGVTSKAYIDNLKVYNFGSASNRLGINALTVKQGTTIIDDFCQVTADGGTVTAEVKITSNETSDKTATVILAEYADGALVSATPVTAFAEPDEEGTATFTFDTAITNENWYMRSLSVFLWDLDSLTPYAENVIFR